MERGLKMHSYIHDEETDEWVVIFYLPHPQIEPRRHAINVVKRLNNERSAARWVSFLNGGNGGEEPQ